LQILIRIFTFIRPSDRNSAALTCHRWFEALRHPYFLNATCFHFEHIEVSDNKSPIKIFLDSFRHFTNIKLTRVQFSGETGFWSYFGEHIREITFDNCALTKPKLSNILGSMPNLERLNIVDCDELFKSWNPVIFQNISPICKRLKHLGLRKISALNEDHLNYLVAMAPRMSSLEISKCLRDMDAGQRVTILSHILRILNFYKHQMRSVNFSYTMYDDLFLKQFAEIESMSLSNISLSFFQRAPIKDPAIIDILRKHTNLVHLDLTSFLNLTDFALIEIAESMPLLKTLKLNGCWLLTDFGISAIGKLRNLAILDLSDCDRVTDNGFLQAILGKDRVSMKELYLSMLPGITENVILKICFTLANLTVLDFCGSDCINDTSLQFVFCYLRLVRVLRLNGCVKNTPSFSSSSSHQPVEIHPLQHHNIYQNQYSHSHQPPAGFNGPFSSPPLCHAQPTVVQQTPLPLSTVQFPPDAGLTGVDLQRAAIEIWDEQQTFSIDMLRGLQELQISGCFKVTDLSLTRCFKLIELREVNLSHCVNISDEGIIAMAMNCPSLEVVDLSDCFRICDPSIDALTKHLLRLNSMKLVRLPQLTTESIYSILAHCKRLRTINLRGCCKIPRSAIDLLAKMKCLRNTPKY
ncbi:hypothetical protein RP20_CCG020755, partial [Aedes albopictus]